MNNVILSLKAQDTQQKEKRGCKSQRNKKFTYLLEMTGKFYPRCLNKTAACEALKYSNNRHANMEKDKISQATPTKN